MKSKLWLPWLIWVIAAISVPTIVFLIWGNGDKIDWVGFWSGYAGAILGSAASLIAFYMTSKQNKEFHKDSIRQGHRENNNTRREMREQNRLQILPYIAIAFNNLDTINIDINKSGKVYDVSGQSAEAHLFDSSNDFYKCLGAKVTKIENKHYNLFCLAFKNVGNGTAINCRIRSINIDKNPWLPLESIMCGETKYCYVLFPLQGRFYNFELEFNDMQSRIYSQSFNSGFVKVFNQVNTTTTESSMPKLKISN